MVASFAHFTSSRLWMNQYADYKRNHKLKGNINWFTATTCVPLPDPKKTRFVCAAVWHRYSTLNLNANCSLHVSLASIVSLSAAVAWRYRLYQNLLLSFDANFQTGELRLNTMFMRKHVWETIPWNQVHSTLVGWCSEIAIEIHLVFATFNYFISICFV